MHSEGDLFPGGELRDSKWMALLGVQWIRPDAFGTWGPVALKEASGVTLVRQGPISSFAYPLDAAHQMHPQAAPDSPHYSQDHKAQSRI
jgi:hypothetical protein